MLKPINTLQHKEIVDLLVCPHCKNPIKLMGKDKFECLNRSCRREFPIVNDVPILINDDSSLFSIKDTTFNISKDSSWKAMARKLMPELSLNPLTEKNLMKLEEEILKEKSMAIVLVIGGGVVGKGMKRILSNPNLKFVESDVYWGPRTNLMCDAHGIPFKNNSMDAVIIQAVLEHVKEPHRCVEEINRVLKNNGLVYSETPFIQQVHMGKYDFTRFTHLGHRCLFRKFRELESGPACGPAMALAWSYKYFLSAFARSKKVSKILGFLGAITSFWLVYLDYYLIRMPGSYDSASSYFFLGRKSNVYISDIEILKQYKGLL